MAKTCPRALARTIGVLLPNGSAICLDQGVGVADAARRLIEAANAEPEDVWLVDSPKSAGIRHTAVLRLYRRTRGGGCSGSKPSRNVQRTFTMAPKSSSSSRDKGRQRGSRVDAAECTQRVEASETVCGDGSVDALLVEEDLIDGVEVIVEREAHKPTLTPTMETGEITNDPKIECKSNAQLNEATTEESAPVSVGKENTDGAEIMPNRPTQTPIVPQHAEPDLMTSNQVIADAPTPVETHGNEACGSAIVRMPFPLQTDNTFADKTNMEAKILLKGHGEEVTESEPAMGLPAHIPMTHKVSVDDMVVKKWAESGGVELEAMLESGAVSLLDAKWIIDLAERGGVLLPRQAMPDDAFLSLNQVRAAVGEIFLPIVCISHYWFQADHPDPHGHNLRIIARGLKTYLNHEAICPSSLAVFFDFSSMHQHCRAADGQARQHILTDANDEGAEESFGRYTAEDEHFEKAIHDVSLLFSHPNTHVWKLTKFPSDYADPMRCEQSNNVASHKAWGWCFYEELLAEMVKPMILVLDLGHDCGREWEDIKEMVDTCMTARRVPLTPSEVTKQLERKTFTNGNTDRPVIARLYAECFTRRFGEVRELHYARLGWGDSEICSLAAVLRESGAACLKVIGLEGNSIGDGGAIALAEVIREFKVLEVLDLSGNGIGSKGAIALTEGIRELKSLKELYLTGNKLGNDGAAALAKSTHELLALKEFHLDENEIGDDGAIALAESITGLTGLEELSLEGNHIGDRAKGVLQEKAPAGLTICA